MAVSEQRRLERLVVDHIEGLVCRLSGAGWPDVEARLIDINGGGLMAELPPGAPVGSSDSVKRVHVVLEGRELGVRQVDKVVFHRPDAPADAPRRISVVFKQTWRDLYVEPNHVERINGNRYRLREDGPYTDILRVLLQGDGPYVTRRRSDRVVFPLELGIRVVGMNGTDAAGEPMGWLSDISRHGVGLAAETSRVNGAPWWRYTRLRIERDGRILGEHEYEVVYDRLVQTPQGLMHRVGLQFPVPLEKVELNPLVPIFQRAFGFVHPPSISDAEQVIRSLLCKESDLRIRCLANPPSPEELEELARFRYRIYLDEGRIDPQAFPDGRLLDEYDRVGYHLSARVYGALVGDVRLIPETAVERFDLEQHVDRPLRIPGKPAAEISRFCVERPFRHKANMRLKVFLQLCVRVYVWALSQGMRRLVIVTDCGHFELYEALGFRVVGDIFRIPGYLLELGVMDLDLDELEQRMHPKLYPYFERARKEWERSRG